MRKSQSCDEFLTLKISRSNYKYVDHSSRLKNKYKLSLKRFEFPRDTIGVHTPKTFETERRLSKVLLKPFSK